MTKHDPDLSKLFHALADPTRRATLSQLARSPAPVSQIAAPTGLKLPTVMRHLSVLEEAGLITTKKHGRTRTCAIVPDALAPAQSWMQQQRVMWEECLGRLEAFVTEDIKENDNER